MIRIKNYMITTPVINILYDLRRRLSNGKLKDIKPDTLDIVVTCPNSEHAGGLEHNPDCHINVDENNRNVPVGFFHCFACGASGTFIKFVSLCFDSSIDFAEEWLIKNYGVESSEQIDLADDIIVSNSKKIKSNYLDETILDQYQTWTPYLAKRKLSREMCNNFKVRYDPKYRQVIFPIYDIKGHLKMLAKRNIDTKIFYMDRLQEKEVYGLNIIQKNNIKKALITEGPIDLLSGWTHGIPTVATLGNVSSYQIEQLNKSCLSFLYLAFDNDEYGRRFAEFVKNNLDKRIITVDVELPKDKKDLNDLSEEDWQNLIIKYFSE